MRITGARALLAGLVVAVAAALSGCSMVGGAPMATPSGSPSQTTAPSAALRLVPVIWRVRDAAGESAATWIRFDSGIDLIRPKGDVFLSWSTQGGAILTHVEGWSMSLGSTPPTVPWLTSTTAFARDGDGWVLTDADGRRTARLVRDGSPPPSNRTIRSVPEVDADLRGQHTDAVPGAAVRGVDPAAVVGTWGLPGVAVADGSVSFTAAGTWSTRTSCAVLGQAAGGGGGYRLLPDGFLLATEGGIAGVGCAAPQHAPPPDATAILRFATARSLAVGGSRLTVYDRVGHRLGTLVRKA